MRVGDLLSPWSCLAWLSRSSYWKDDLGCFRMREQAGNIRAESEPELLRRKSLWALLNADGFA